MTTGYKILITGTAPGKAAEQVAAALSPILRQAPEQLLPALRTRQAITLRATGIDLTGARAFREKMEAAGAVCKLDSLEPLSPPAPAPRGDFSTLPLRAVAHRAVGLALNAPAPWSDISDGELFRLKQAGTQTYYTASRANVGWATLPVWAEIRFGTIPQSLPFLKPHRAPYSLDTAAGLAIVAEFRGLKPGDGEVTHQLVLCLQPEGAAVSLNITATVADFEQHEALHQWLLRTQLRLYDASRDAVAAAREHPQQQFDTALRYAQADRFADAAAWCRKAAEQGHANAQYMLGNFYVRGQGVVQDEGQAFAWWKRAAEQGVGGAQYNLASMLERGVVGQPDLKQAFEWYRKSALQGDREAQYAVAVCYILGQGVAQSMEHGAPWALKAAEQGHAGAQVYLGVMHEHGDGLPLDRNSAIGWYRKAAAQGNANAKKRLQAMGL